MDQAAVWLSSSILVMLGILVITIIVIFINNILHRYWKPVTIFSRESFGIFGGHHHVNDSLYSVNQEEYDQLVKHLEKIRTANKNQMRQK
jgi:hypothetical protein